MFDPMLASLKKLESDVKLLRRDIKAEKVTQIAKKALRERAEKLGTTWFSDIDANLRAVGPVSPDVVERFSVLFGRLIKLSTPNNLKTSYLEALISIAKTFRQDIIIPVQTSGGQPSTANQLETLLSDVSIPAQTKYLTEAVACAKHQLFRGSAVLGWCAAIDQIHHAIERIGLSKFNTTSAAMATETKGRFKKFSQVQNVSSLSELREVFDTVVLWILEGMQLIDSNQHTRLRSCFELRCQCAHPGEAPVTEFNLLSFFSDLKLIVFENAMLAP